MRQTALMLAFLLLASPVLAADKVIQFDAKDWGKVLHQIELDQQERKLLRRQNADLKQLITLNAEQSAQCDKLTEAQNEMAAVDDEYRRSLEQQNTLMKESLYQYGWVIKGETAVIVGLMAWIAWLVW